jgi:ABC-2 type transport system ATP-binding protein
MPPVTDRERGDAIAVEGLTKRYGAVTAVDDLTFRVRAGAITGFLGPNGAGKTTTLRMLVGLARPTSGRALVFGRPYGELEDPARTVGAALEVSGFHPGRSGRQHLRSLAAMAGLPEARVGEVLALVELEDAANRRVGGYSLGMRQRLALAATLLGDPRVLVLDEPANGLDPAGVRWLRDFLRERAAEGRTVLVSSHVLVEVAQTVDDVVVIAGGRLVHQGTVAELTGGRVGVRVRTTEPERLAAVLARAGGEVRERDGDLLLVTGLDPRVIGEVALAEAVLVYELGARAESLEDAFLALTGREAAPR